MNKPATKDPSMDEILSSIRQIIAEDDDADETAGVTEVNTESQADAELVAAAATEVPEEDAPLALSPEQMVSEPEEQEEELADFEFEPASSGMDTVSPQEPEPVVEAEIEPVAQIEEPETIDAPEEIELVVADDIGFEDVDPIEEMEEVAPTIGEIAPMPDPDLSSDMAEKLLAPTTDAAVRHTFSKLNSLTIGGTDLTLEAIVREMLRPMLKEWLDEHLPATVERMVEKEIERVSRGE